MDIREYFKAVYKEAIGPSQDRKILQATHVPPLNKTMWSYLTPEWIDALSDEEVERQLAWFIGWCFRAR